MRKVCVSIPSGGRGLNFLAGEMVGLNKRFEQAAQDVMGKDQFFYLRHTKGFEEAKLQFDKSIKVSFRGGADEEYFVNFPMMTPRITFRPTAGT